MPNVTEQLMDGCKQGKLDLVKKCLLEGADVNFREAENGDTALHVAVTACDYNRDVILFLLNNGANYKAKNIAGKMPHEVLTLCNANKVVVIDYADRKEWEKEQQFANTLKKISEALEQHQSINCLEK